MANEARLPTLSVLVDGAPLAGTIDAQTTTNSHLAAGRFRVRAALAAAGPQLLNRAAFEVEIQARLDDASTVLMLGDADRMDVDAIRGEIIIEGRDFAGRLLESRTQETFENQSASEIAIVIAARHGLLPAVVPTAPCVGRNFQNGHVRTTLIQHARATTEWDLLARLAEEEGFDVWVDQRTLNFAPVLSFLSSVSISPSDCTGLRLERDLSLENGLDVVVKSWDCRGERVVTQTATGASAASGSRYELVRPNLLAESAQSLAAQILAQMTQHARTIHVEMPGELTMTPRTNLVLGETGTDFDGTYVISSVDRHLSARLGFVQSVEARGISWTDS